MNSPTTRFSPRVSHYVKARPGYPSALLDYLKRELGLLPSHAIAEVGSGTGILTGLLLGNGNTVFAVEPNEPMRSAAEEMLGQCRGFRSVDGTAEATTLEDGSVDLVMAAQAFHWFDPIRARREFARILKRGGEVVLIWNDRKTAGTGFSESYERFIQEHNKEPEVLHCRHLTRDQEKVIGAFFAPGGFEKQILANEQRLDLEGLVARVLSSSYMPMCGDARYEPMMAALKLLFYEHERAGQVVIEYDTTIYHGPLI